MSVAGAAEVRAADERSFDDLFERERTAMVRVAFLLVGSEQLAEEIVQDAFTSVHLRWARLDRPGAYLRQCVVNGARRALRRRTLERRHLRAVVDEGRLAPARERSTRSRPCRSIVGPWWCSGSTRA